MKALLKVGLIILRALKDDPVRVASEVHKVVAVVHEVVFAIIFIVFTIVAAIKFLAMLWP